MHNLFICETQFVVILFLKRTELLISNANKEEMKQNLICRNFLTDFDIYHFLLIINYKIGKYVCLNKNAGGRYPFGNIIPPLQFILLSKCSLIIKASQLVRKNTKYEKRPFYEWSLFYSCINSLAFKSQFRVTAYLLHRANISIRLW